VVVSPDQAPHAIDKDIRLGQTYEYRAQRVIRVPFTNMPESNQPQTTQTSGDQSQTSRPEQDQTLELAGPLSDTIRVDAADIFPPEIPTGLEAVPTQNGPEISIDLSWRANTDTDLAGYAVYRREGDGPWQRISPAEPVVGPGFHDAHVRPGQAYRYAVTALDQAGHESAPSAEAEETAPQP
jgi:fibronectin type 3 domain-containing protein